MATAAASTPPTGLHRAAAAVAVWAAGWAAMLALDGRLDLANLALLMVLASAVAAVWLPAWAGALASALAVLAFNWAFVPPRHQLAVDLRQHTLLLATMLVVHWTISVLVVRQRDLAAQARRLAGREARLRAWADTLRDAADPAAHASALHEALAEAAGVPVAVAVRQRLGDRPDGDGLLVVGTPDADRRAGLALCIRDGRPMGPGTGRYEEQPDAYLPLRGRGVTLGAAVLCGLGAAPRGDDGGRAHLQALCDQLGGALQRALLDGEERRVREAAQAASLRNAMLAAIAHDYRTPLATIVGAASSLLEQEGRLDAAQRRRLAEGIVDEAGRLARLADNTLQLARLGAPGVAPLHCDWESAEEIVGEVLRRARRRPDGARLRSRLEPGLPLLWCDALLVHQLLDNLVDNALKYSPPEQPVELLARRVGDEMLLAVRDRGPGVPPGARAQVFEVFARHAGPGVPGAGVGLAVCRAIAAAHGGTLVLRPRAHGGSAFELRLPLREPPAATPEATAP